MPRSCIGFWERALTADERGGVRQFLGSEGYDTGYEELMYNEMQAYLMFTRDPEFFTAGAGGHDAGRLADLQGTFLRGMPTGWLQRRARCHAGDHTRLRTRALTAASDGFLRLRR